MRSSSYAAYLGLVERNKAVTGEMERKAPPGVVIKTLSHGDLMTDKP